MSDALQAKFRLTFSGDEVTRGMGKMIDLMKQFKALAKSLGFSGLDGADATVRALGKDIGTLNTGLSATTRQAEAAASAIKRMSSAELARVRASAEAGRRIAASGGSLGTLYGPGGMPLFAPGAGMPAAPGGPSSRMGLRGRASNMWDRTRERAGALQAQVGLMGGAMAGISLEHTIHAAAELDAVLRQVAIIDGKTGASAETEIARLRHVLAEDSTATGQPLLRLAEAYKDLVSRGMSTELVDHLLPIHSRAATAYRVDAESMGQAVYALNNTLGIGHEEMSGALASMMQATHAGKFDMTNLSRYLPAISGLMKGMGMTGRGSLDSVVAALEVVSRTSGTPEETATNFKDMLQAMTGPYAVKAFKKVGVNLPARLSAARQAGVNPMDAYLDVLETLIKGIDDPVQQAFKLGKVLHNQQAGTAARGLLQNRRDQRELTAQLGGIGADKLDRDYRTAMQGLEPALMLRAAKVQALEQRLGLGFAWTVPVSSALLGGVLYGLDKLDHILPGAADGAIGLTGGMLGLVAVMGVLGTVAGPVKAGFLLLRPILGALLTPVRMLWSLLLANPMVAVAAVMIAAAVDIWRHWDRFRANFQGLWQGLGHMFGGLGQVLAGAFTFDGHMMLQGFRDIAKGAKQLWENTFGPHGLIVKLADDLVSLLPQSLQNIGVAFNGWFDRQVIVIKAGLARWTQEFLSWMPEIHLPDIHLPPLNNGGPAEGPVPPTQGAPGGPSRPVGSDGSLFHPTAFRAAPQWTDGSPGSRPGAPHFHLSFEADVPGRATVRDSNGRVFQPQQMRGPTLSRA